MRLWLHEASRVYADKLLDEKDMQQFNKLKFSIAKDNFDVGYMHKVKLFTVSVKLLVFTQHNLILLCYQ